MELLADGKTKTLYALDNDQVLMVFKDDVTGSEEGIDPGGNVVVGRLEGKGLAALQQSIYFFDLLGRHGIPTHYVARDPDRGAIIVRRAQWFGLEFIVRFKAFGSFVRRYGRYVDEGAPLDGLVEITLKDDERGDPLIVDEAIAAIGLMPLDQVQEAKALVRQAAQIMHDHLAEKGLDLVDIKFECGLAGGRLVIIDDISTDNMRVMQDGRRVEAGQLLPLLGAGNA
ncbi:MAG TPA: phosphoribosylaminoimidazolesuccinocarboxamide synthase [Sphingobacteriaceae bacterium]|nr:phosphoribosylaminoimidazolesuccinocarboxamide synthase [Sphingobacteriaceae bacterium]